MLNHFYGKIIIDKLDDDTKVKISHLAKLSLEGAELWFMIR